ncbi:MAG: Ca2+-binding EF-hand superfamily protein [Pirellulaceae bacterium]|jgi:Ca2+-binding EF-hand superfamily protein
MQVGIMNKARFNDLVFGLCLGVFSVSVLAIAPPTASAQSATAILKRLDRNGDGVVKQDEVPETLRPVLEKYARQNFTSLERGVPVQKKKERNSALTSSSSSDSVPGFGEQVDLPEVPGFGDGASAVVLSLEDRFDDRVIRYVDGIFKQYDANKNGYLDKAEWAGVRWQSDPGPSDLNNDDRLSRDEFCERIVKRWGKGRKAPPAKTSSSSAASVSKSTPSTRSSSGVSTGSSVSTNGAADDKTKRYAEALMRQYDTNKNGVLEKDEWGKMRGDWAAADSNQDTLLSSVEITNKLAGFGSRSNKTSSSSSVDKKAADSRSGRGRSRYSSSPSKTSSSEKKSYRFKTVAERLPQGLPDWFVRNDVNKDGQIMMSEYSTAWSDLKVREFQKYDLNNDGVITPEEFGVD